MSITVPGPKAGEILEPGVVSDRAAALDMVSISPEHTALSHAISAKRTADALERIAERMPPNLSETLTDFVNNATNALYEAMRNR